MSSVILHKLCTCHLNKNAVEDLICDDCKVTSSLLAAMSNAEEKLHEMPVPELIKLRCGQICCTNCLSSRMDNQCPNVCVCGYQCGKLHT